MADVRPARAGRQIDHAALGNLVPLRDLVHDLRARAQEVDWSGDVEIARRLDRAADEAISRGADPVPMF